MCGRWPAMRLQHGGSRCFSPCLRCVSLGPLSLGVGLTVGGLWPCVLPWVGVRPPEAGGLVAPPSCAVIPARPWASASAGQCLYGVEVGPVIYLGTHPIETGVCFPLTQSDSQCEDHLYTLTHAHTPNRLRLARLASVRGFRLCRAMVFGRPRVWPRH